MKVSLKEIKVVSLNIGTILLLTQFVRLARVCDGADLRMQQANIVHRVFRYAAKSENPDLIVLLMRIKKSMSIHIKNSKLDHA
ncbi:MAG: hypothetical protein ACI9OI_000557 [Chitinophagales bacterium]|jgi:hypothetical protein